MNTKKILILLILFVAVMGLTISTVSAETFEAYCHGGSVEHKANWTKTFSEKVYDHEVVKKKGEYYKVMLHLYEFEEQPCYHESHNKEYWPNGYSYVHIGALDPRCGYDTNLEKYMTYSYVKVKKGEVIEKSDPKYWKTIQSNGKIQKVYKVIKTVAVTTKKLQKITSTTKKTTAYYKTYKMPTFKPNQYKWGSFKGNTFTYGNSYIGYYVNHLQESGYYNSKHRVYKVTPKTSNLLGSYMFYKKPSSFTLYAYA